MTDLPVKYGRKQLRKANTRTTLGPESPILNWGDGALFFFNYVLNSQHFQMIFHSKKFVLQDMARNSNMPPLCTQSQTKLSCKFLFWSLNGSRRRSRRLSAGDRWTLARTPLHCCARTIFWARAITLRTDLYRKIVLDDSVLGYLISVWLWNFKIVGS